MHLSEVDDTLGEKAITGHLIAGLLLSNRALVRFLEVDIVDGGGPSPPQSRMVNRFSVKDNTGCGWQVTLSGLIPCNI